MSLTPGNKPLWSLEDLSPENPEGELFNSYICEFVDIAGVSIQFYIKNHTNIDPLYGESTLETMDGPYKTKAIYPIQGEQSVFSVFGLSSDETIDTMYLPKTLFARDVKDEYLPVPGDVIRTLWNDKLYEIVNASFETKVFQLKKYVIELILRPYRMDASIEDTFIEGNLNNFNEFPEINLDRTMNMPLSGGSDNEFIRQKEISETKYDDVDSNMYGFDKD